MDNIERVAVSNSTTHLSEDESGFWLVEVATRIDVV